MTLGALSAADISGSIVQGADQPVNFASCVVGSVDPTTGDTVAYCPPQYIDQQLQATAQAAADARMAALPGLPASTTNWGLIGVVVSVLALLMAAKK